MELKDSFCAASFVKKVLATFFNWIGMKKLFHGKVSLKQFTLHCFVNKNHFKKKTWQWWNYGKTITSDDISVFPVKLKIAFPKSRSHRALVRPVPRVNFVLVPWHTFFAIQHFSKNCYKICFLRKENPFDKGQKNVLRQKGSPLWRRHVTVHAHVFVTKLGNRTAPALSGDETCYPHCYIKPRFPWQLTYFWHRNDWPLNTLSGPWGKVGTYLAETECWSGIVFDRSISYPVHPVHPRHTWCSRSLARRSVPRACAHTAPPSWRSPRPVCMTRRTPQTGSIPGNL